MNALPLTPKPAPSAATPIDDGPDQVGHRHNAHGLGDPIADKPSAPNRPTATDHRATNDTDTYHRHADHSNPNHHHANHNHADHAHPALTSARHTPARSALWRAPHLVSVLGWPAWLRVLAVLPVLLLLWLAVAWASAEVAPW